MKKRIFILALVICMVAIVGLGSLAYFQSSKSLTNYFAVAGITDPTDPDETIDPDELFSIKLDEQSILGEGRTESGNIYADIMPGDTLTKDPTITNTGKYDAWVRMKVTVTDAADWTAVCAKHGITDLANIFNGFVPADWDREISEDLSANNSITYTYYYKNTVAPGDTAKLFDSLTIPEVLDVNDMAALSTFQLKIVGEAIQTANTGSTPQEAFALWEN